MSAVARRRVIAVAVVAALAVIGVMLVGGGGSGDDRPIATGAAALVPRDALVYLHVSTDTERDAVEQARDLAASFPGYTRLRDSILRRLTVRDPSAWLGDEVAVALLDSSSGTAGSLVVLAVDDEDAARKAIGDRRTSSYRGVELVRFGRVTAALVGDHVVLGQPASVRRAIDLEQGRGRPLAADAQYRRATDELPDDRVADAYATGDGVRRLLAPAGGVLGAAGTLLNRPGLDATALALSAKDPGAVLTARSLSRGAGASFRAFEPELVEDVPADVLAYLGVRGFDDTATRLLSAAGAQAQVVTGLLGAAQRALGQRRSAEVQRFLVEPLRGEAALMLGAPGTQTVLTLMAAARDEARTRTALTALGTPLRRVLRDLKVTSTRVEGVPVTVFRAGSQLSVYAAVFDGRLVLSTDRAGIAATHDPASNLADQKQFKAVIDPAGEVGAVGFLDFDQLLKLGERTGLTTSRAYQAVRADLAQVRAVGFSSSGTGGDTTAEIRFDIP